MQNRRALILMGLLLALIALVVGRPLWSGNLAPAASAPPPLPGMNAITKFAITREADGGWMAHVDYFYTGEPAGAFLAIESVRSGASEKASGNDPGTMMRESIMRGVVMRPAERGAHRLDVEINRPGDVVAETSTAAVRGSLQRGGLVLATQTLAQTIDWPDQQTFWTQRTMRSKTSEQILKQAIEEIDSDDRGALEDAKNSLEYLIARDPHAVQAYVELARCAMKRHWGPDGLHQAETLLDSALTINKQNKNARVLQAYVYAHQGRYAQAMKLNDDIVQSGTDNLWAWANWGEAYEMQGNAAQAIAKYREALAQARQHNTYDRAQSFAYDHLINLLSLRKDLDGLQATYEQHVKMFGKTDCATAQFARFLLEQRGDVHGAVEQAEAVAAGNCRDPYALRALGLVWYGAWAASTEANRDGLLNKARVNFPPGPQLLLALAGSEHTMPTLRLLLTRGEKIDEHDNDQLNALAYALQAHDYAVAKRLLSLGAKAEATVGFEAMPVALIPVIDEDREGIHLMQGAGVNYTTLQYRGTTAVDLARRNGNTRMLEWLKDPRLKSDA